jgi:chemotaxis signal transduction protein
METKQYCTFYLDDQCFGVEVQQVQEVIRYQELTRVPLASPVVSGLINLRGQIVTAIDLRRRIGMIAYERGGKNGGRDGEFARRCDRRGIGNSDGQV